MADEFKKLKTYDLLYSVEDNMVALTFRHMDGSTSRTCFPSADAAEIGNALMERAAIVAAAQRLRPTTNDS